MQQYYLYNPVLSEWRCYLLTHLLLSSLTGETLTDEAGNEHRLSAEVMLLTRNIVVKGGEHDDMIRYGYGGRILVSAAVNDDGSSLVGE